jgi:protein-S-isoprenylcysteine O-methyltransferase Ste14
VGFGPKNLGLSEPEIKERVIEALQKVGLGEPELMEKSPFELSGGQMRRVAMAGVLAMRPKILVLDEPESNLDFRNQLIVLETLTRLAGEGMAVLFNTVNAYMQGGWIFYFSPADYYGPGWLTGAPFLAGTALFLFGMGVNIQSDCIIRDLRKPGDTAHYLPRRGLFRWVTSANYFGEWVEWTGFAILTWSLSGAVFALWTFANLTPRAARIYNRYRQEFPDQLDTGRTKRMIPFIF